MVGQYDSDLLFQSDGAEEVLVADGDYGWIMSPGEEEQEEEAAFDETRFKDECASRAVFSRG